MQTCSSKGSFNDYLVENMEALGLMAPDSIFKAGAATIATLKSLESAHAIFSGVGVNELITRGASSAYKGEALTLAASGFAAFYTGALIGSIAIASQRSMTCGKRLSDYFSMMPSAGFSDKEISEIKKIINNHPAIMNSNLPNRKAFVVRARLAV